MVDYSKWKDIEISDDEDDTHPNIDTPSLYRWRHQARVERMAEMEQERESFVDRRQSQRDRLRDVKERIRKNAGDEAELKKELEQIENEGKELDREEQELKKREKKTPWNVDTISKPGFAKTVINKLPKRQNTAHMTDEEREEHMRQFVKENEKLCKQYGMMQKYDDSKRFLMEYLHLVCDDTANYLVIWSINLEMEGKHDLMGHVAHQCICMQYILELAKQLDVDPRACVASFFTKIQNCLPEYREQFESEIAGFKERIKKRAQEKLQEAIAEAEEEERNARIGPGGLDPAEVFEDLPDDLKACFESRDIELLQKTIAAMPIDVAKYHMKRCVDSGLWVPNTPADGEQPDLKNSEGAADAAEPEKENPKADKENPEEKEPIYTGVCTDDLD